MKTRTGMIALALVCQASASIAQESIDDQTKRVNLEKAKADLDKSKASALDPLRSTSGGTTNFQNAEKSAEGIAIKDRIYQGLAANLAVKLSALSPPAAKVVPIIVMGSTPPTVAHWLSFEAQREKLLSDLNAAAGRWEDIASQSCVKPPAQGSAGQTSLLFIWPAIVATAVSAFKPDYSFGGATITEIPSDAENAVALALSALNYDVDLTAFKVNRSGKTDAKNLLADLQKAYGRAKSDYQNGYLPCLAKAGGKAEKIESDDKAAAGPVLKALMDSYDGLEKALYVEANGQIQATIIAREEILAGNTSQAHRPIVYVLAHEAALTVMTKKSFFTGWDGPSSKFTALGTITYVLMTGDGKGHRGSVTCKIADQTIAAVRAFRPDADPKTWAAICPP